MSSFSSIEQSLIQLLADAVPTGVKVTALPVQQAANSKTRGRRINVAFLRVAMDSTARNVPTPPAGRTGTSPAFPVHLDYLISVHSSDYATPDARAAALIESALRAVESHPILATPPTANQGITSATLTIIDQSIHEWAQLWTALQSPWQPALLLRIRIT